MPCGLRQLRQLIGTDAYSELTHGHGETRESQAGPASGARQFGASVRCVNPPHPLAHPRALGAARKRLAGEARKASKPVRKPPPRMCACEGVVDAGNASDGRSRHPPRCRWSTWHRRLRPRLNPAPPTHGRGSPCQTRGSAANTETVRIESCEASITARGTCILAGAPLKWNRESAKRWGVG